MNKPQIILYTDGASRGNPGPSSIGVVAYPDDGAPGNKKELFSISKYLIDSQTNNWAEYQAILAGLEESLKQGFTKVLINSDSELIVRQLSGIYKVKNSNIIPLYKKVKNLISKLDRCEIHHIPRNKNKRADALANLALDSHS